MKELYLRDCYDTFYKMDRNRKYSVYHDPINNNLLVFNPYDDCTIDEVCDATVSEGAYEYLIDLLNTSTNIVVNWSEVSGTTSDYIIYHDFNVNDLVNKTHKEIMNILPRGYLHYKFTEFKNGEESIIDTKKFLKEQEENNQSLSLGEWDTEIEAAQAYNIGALILEGEDAELNDVPSPSIETFNKVIELMNEQGWHCSEQDMNEIKYLMKIYLHMDFEKV
jgi:hypothetical protein